MFPLVKPAVRFSSPLVIVPLAAVVVATVALLVTLTGPARNPVAPLLLNVTELPASWMATVSQAPTLDIPKSACLSNFGQRPQAELTSASASFAERSGLPGLGEYLVTGSKVRSEFTKGVRALAACHTLAFTSGKKTYRATIRRITLAELGEGSVAYSLEFNIANFPFFVDLVLFHTSKYLGEVVYSDSVAPQATTLEHIAREAVAKVEGRVVTASALSIVSVPVGVAHTGAGAVGYRRFGKGPPLLLITGYGGTMEAWDPRFVDALALHHTVVMFDNAGIGRTQALPSPLTIDAMAGQTSALIDALGLKRPDVLGWSMGGMIAQALAVEHPTQVGSLILCATFPGVGTVWPSPTAIADLRSTDSAKVLSVLFPPDQAAAKAAFTIATGNYPSSRPAPSAVVRQQKLAVDEWFNGRDPAGRQTREINAPTLVADGANDLLDPLANDHRLASEIPGSRLVIRSDAGHAFLFQEATTFVALVQSFLIDR